TANRSTSTVNAVPMTVSALTDHAAEVEGVKSVDDLSRLVPGLTFRLNSFERNPAITIRGIGGYDALVGAATTGVYLDDSSLTQRNLNGARTGNGTPLPEIFDLDRVEVLRGPQGTLYGGSSEGGTVRFITRSPSLTSYTGEVRTDVSSTAMGAPSYETGLAIGGPVVRDQLGFRLSGLFRHEGGWIDALSMYDGHKFASDVNYGDFSAVRGALKWQVDPSLSITSSVYFDRDYSNQPDTVWKPTPQINYVGSTIYNGSPAPELGQAYAGGACTVLTAVAPTPGPCRTASGAYFAFPNTTMPAYIQAGTPWY